MKDEIIKELVDAILLNSQLEAESDDTIIFEDVKQVERIGDEIVITKTDNKKYKISVKEI